MPPSNSRLRTVNRMIRQQLQVHANDAQQESANLKCRAVTATRKPRKSRRRGYRARDADDSEVNVEHAGNELFDDNEDELRRPDVYNQQRPRSPSLTPCLSHRNHRALPPSLCAQAGNPREDVGLRGALSIFNDTLLLRVPPPGRLFFRSSDPERLDFIVYSAAPPALDAFIAASKHYQISGFEAAVEDTCYYPPTLALSLGIANYPILDAIRTALPAGHFITVWHGRMDVLLLAGGHMVLVEYHGALTIHDADGRAEHRTDNGPRVDRVPWRMRARGRDGLRGAACPSHAETAAHATLISAEFDRQ
ncbi:hypothetical protein GGX14DRAFT_655265 [Mycena pura]|uniref:Uncharacterized protein n=1 Tax=Mycena pura TaxID=153505 RepID=A0AAD6V7V4_9AGAR|nr:hypothetical protein GGX14DRAFT_655265 [Mycena pura]